MEYRLIRSRRKTVALQLTPQGELVVRCPMAMPQKQVDAFVQSKRSWVERHRATLTGQAQPKLTEEQLRQLAQQAAEDLRGRVSRLAPLAGVDYGRVTIRAQRSRWGSCSAQGNLNFNCLLMLVPEEIRDYVVVHELCHRKQMNHSAAFWAEVEQILPDYRQRRKWLKENGNQLIARLI